MAINTINIIFCLSKYKISMKDITRFCKDWENHRKSFIRFLNVQLRQHQVLLKRISPNEIIWHVLSSKLISHSCIIQRSSPNEVVCPQPGQMERLNDEDFEILSVCLLGNKFTVHGQSETLGSVHYGFLLKYVTAWKTRHAAVRWNWSVALKLICDNAIISATTSERCCQEEIASGSRSLFSDSSILRQNL